MSVRTVPDSKTEKIIIDTYAWIEYFRGGPEAKVAAKFIDADLVLLTPAMVVAELSDKYRRSGLGEIWEKERLLFVGIKSDIVPIDVTIADMAGKIKVEKRKEFDDFGLGDALILAVARINKARILTGDKHMRTDANTIDITK